MTTPESAVPPDAGREILEMVKALGSTAFALGTAAGEQHAAYDYDDLSEAVDAAYAAIEAAVITLTRTVERMTPVVEAAGRLVDSVANEDMFSDADSFQVASSLIWQLEDAVAVCRAATPAQETPA